MPKTDSEFLSEVLALIDDPRFGDDHTGVVNWLLDFREAVRRERIPSAAPAPTALGYWRSPTGENHGTDSKPGDVWTAVKGGVESFDYTHGATTYRVEIESGGVVTVFDDDLLFAVERLDTSPIHFDTIRMLLRAFYVGRQEGEGCGRAMLRHQLRELLDVPAKG